MRRSLIPALFAFTLAALLPGAAAAQPFDGWLSLAGNPSHGYVRIPHSSALNPTGAFTIEAWVAISTSASGEDCRSIVGKNWQQAWWLGLCNVGGKPTLRSYLKGNGSARNGGEIPPGQWTHVAVVFDGANRRHYINGEQAAAFPESGPLTTSTAEVRIGSDVSWQFTPSGAIDEVRLWNVARTTAQLRSTINQRLHSPQAGLVAVWSPVDDEVGARDGILLGAGVGILTFPAGPHCSGSSATQLCLHDRFLVSTEWRTNPTPGAPTDGDGKVVSCANDGSGLFWFFTSDNWEVMVKALDACGLNGHWWIFSAATTNVFYRMEVYDTVGFEQKIYFNYPGPPAPAVTDTNAFATCP